MVPRPATLFAGHGEARRVMSETSVTEKGGSDLVAEVRIVVPKTLDEESRALIEPFAKLNPTGD